MTGSILVIGLGEVGKPLLEVTLCYPERCRLLRYYF